MHWLELSDTEVKWVARSVMGALRDNSWQEWADPVQPRFFNAIFNGLFGNPIDFWDPDPVECGVALSALTRESARRTAIELMVAGELLCRPIPPDVHVSVERWAAAFGIEGQSLTLARQTASGAYYQAQADLYRHGYWGAYAATAHNVDAQVARYGVSAFAATHEPDPELAAQWQQLAHCAPGTIGRSVWEFYGLHGFDWPGEPGGANPITAQHDWIHVLADYSATGLGEIETAAFRITSTRLPGTLLTFLGELGFWHSGMIGSAFSGWHQAYSLDAKDAPESVADAFRRGAACNQDLYLETDFFAFKDVNLDTLRERWNIPPKHSVHSPGWKTRTHLTAADGESHSPPDFTI